MKVIDQDGAKAYLRAHRVDSKYIENIVKAFDPRMPIYEHALDGGAEIFQYLRNPSHSDPHPKLGNWFCLRGAAQDGLAIFGGGSGRHVVRITVSHPINVLEGTARSMAIDWTNSIGSHKESGGATQIFIPASLVGRLTGTGPIGQ